MYGFERPQALFEIDRALGRDVAGKYVGARAISLATLLLQACASAISLSLATLLLQL
jgi:hypothetical protein